MQDLQNYQYYDPSPSVIPPPWWRRPRTWQLAGLLAVAVIGLLLVGAAAINILKNRQLADSDQSRLQQAEVVADQLAAECQADDQTCLDTARADAARRLGLAQACVSLTGDELADCVTLIAVDKIEPQVCDLLANEVRSKCSDTPYLLQAKQDLNLVLCEQIVNSATRAACFVQVKIAAIAVGQCQAVGLDETLCEAARLLSEAIASNDPNACQTLNDNDAYACLQAQQQADLDNDGLVAVDEEAFGTSEGVADTDTDGLSDGDEVHVFTTSPVKADTDNDGFSDGTEIESGYDPLK